MLLTMYWFVSLYASPLRSSKIFRPQQQDFHYRWLYYVFVVAAAAAVVVVVVVVVWGVICFAPRLLRSGGALLPLRSLLSGMPFLL